MPSMFARGPASSASQPQRVASAVAFSDTALTVLGHVVCRALAERHYETKKKGAKEIEDVIRFVQEREIGVARDKTMAIINILVSEFLDHKNSEVKVGGLVGLVGAARGLENNTKYYLAQIVIPVMRLFNSNTECTLRYYAAECIFNLCLIAPSDIVVFLDDLVEILFKLWIDPDANINRAAQYLDSSLRELTRAHAAPTQLNSLGKCVTAEFSKKLASPALYLVPWLDLLLDKNEEGAFEFRTPKTIGYLLAMGSYKLSIQQSSVLEKVLERSVRALKKSEVTNSDGTNEDHLQSDIVAADWEYHLAAKLETIIPERHAGTYSLSLIFLRAVAGLPSPPVEAEAPSFSFMDGPADALSFIANHAGFLVNLIYLLLAHGTTHVGFLKMYNSEVERVLMGSTVPEEVVDSNLAELASLSGEVLNSSKKNSSQLVAEVALRWISIITSRRNSAGSLTELPQNCFDAIVSLVSHDNPVVRKLAVACVVQICEHGHPTDNVLSSSLNQLLAIDSPSQALAYMDLISSLIATHANIVATLDTALRSVPSGSVEEAVAFDFVALMTTLALLTGENNAQLWRQLPDEISGSLLKSPMASFLLTLKVKDQASVNVSLIHDWQDMTMMPNWLLTQIEMMVHFLELPIFWKLRCSRPMAHLYAELCLLLPAHSEAHAIAAGRHNVLWNIRLRNSSPQIHICANTFAARSLKNVDCSSLRKFREILLPLLHQFAGRELPIRSELPIVVTKSMPAAAAGLRLPTIEITRPESAGSSTQGDDVICQASPETPVRKEAATFPAAIETAEAAEPGEAAVPLGGETVTKVRSTDRNVDGQKGLTGASAVTDDTSLPSSPGGWP